MLVDMATIIIAVSCLNDVYSRVAGRSGGRRVLSVVMFALLGTILVAEEINTIPIQLSRHREIENLARFALPDRRCKAFFITDSRGLEGAVGDQQSEAMMVAMRLGIPTINGYSGIAPHDAFKLTPVGSEYRYQVLDWLVARHALEGICELDYAAASFHVVNVEVAYRQARELHSSRLYRTFITLLDAATRFLRDGYTGRDLYPQSLEAHGYLDPLLGYQTGQRYKWLNDDIWIGERECGRGDCFAVGTLGTPSELRAILDTYADQARQVYYPSPARWRAGDLVTGKAIGELVMVFSASELAP